MSACIAWLMQEALGVMHRITRIYIIHAGKTAEKFLLVTATSGANLEVFIWLDFGWMQSEAIMGARKEFWQCTLNSRKGRRSSSLASAHTQQGQGSAGQRERRECQLQAKQLFKEI
jgi:hypothetical protein